MKRLLFSTFSGIAVLSLSVLPASAAVVQSRATVFQDSAVRADSIQNDDLQAGDRLSDGQDARPQYISRFRGRVRGRSFRGHSFRGRGFRSRGFRGRSFRRSRFSRFGRRDRLIDRRFTNDRFIDERFIDERGFDNRFDNNRFIDERGFDNGREFYR